MVSTAPILLGRRDSRRRGSSMNDVTRDEVKWMAKALVDKKAFNILILDVRNVCTMTDYFMIAEGNVDRHVQGLYRAVAEAMEQVGREPLHVEGTREGEWIVMDYGTIILHLFIPELRDYYRLEQLWNEGEIVDM